MKYYVVGIYKHEEVVDAEAFGYKHWRESWRGRNYKNEEQAIVNYAKDMLDFQILDDEGRGNLSSLSLDWVIEEVK